MQNEHLSDVQLALYAAGNRHLPPQTKARIQRHLPTCQHCSQQLEAEVEEILASGGDIPGSAASPAKIRKLRWRPSRPASAIAAMALIVVGLSAVYFWPRTPGPILVDLAGSFEPTTPKRGTGQPVRSYRVDVRLEREAYLTFLYLDQSRRLQLPENTGAAINKGFHLFAGQPIAAVDHGDRLGGALQSAGIARQPAAPSG